MIFDKSILYSSTILAGTDRACTADSFYGTQNEQENTQNNVIDGDIIIEITVDTDQKYQEEVEAASNIFFQTKQRDHIHKGHDKMAKTYVDEFLHVSSYPILESMGFDTGISDGVTKMRAATLLGDIFRLHQRTKNSLKYVHTYSKYGNLVAIPASDTQEKLSISARDKGWVDKILLCLSGGK